MGDGLPRQTRIEVSMHLPLPSHVDRLANRLFEACDELDGMTTSLALAATLARICRAVAGDDVAKAKQLAAVVVERGFEWDAADGGGVHPAGAAPKPR